MWVARSSTRARIVHAVGYAWLATGAASASFAAETNTTSSIEARSVQSAGGELYTFYASRNYRAVWFDSQANLTPGASSLVGMLESAGLDSIDSAGLQLASLKSALSRASATKLPADLTQAELLISRTFVAYAQALRSPSGGAMIYEHARLRPKQVTAFHLLTEVANAPSQQSYIDEMRWMHPRYATLRRSVGAHGPIDGPVRKAALATLTRLRGIPGGQRHVLVDLASARLFMYENDRVVDTMRVVVGKPSTPTPLLAGYIRYAIQNPYWNVPPEMVSKNIASNVVSRGQSYLKAGGYEILSGWDDDATVVDPKNIDWGAAARGKLDLRIRQLPSTTNAMGKVKYEFPNPQGIYLHDTPQKDLMQKEGRQFSGGCIRLEDAQRLGVWLMGGSLPPRNDGPEKKVDLPTPIPIYLTYLTVQAEPGRIALAPDPYKLDSFQN